MKLWREGQLARQRANHGNEAAAKEYRNQVRELREPLATEEKQRLDGDAYLLDRIAGAVNTLQRSNAGGRANLAFLTEAEMAASHLYG